MQYERKTKGSDKGVCVEIHAHTHSSMKYFLYSTIPFMKLFKHLQLFFIIDRFCRKQCGES